MLRGRRTRLQIGALCVGKESMFETHGDELPDFAFGKAHADSVGIFPRKVGVEHGGIIGRKNNRNAVTHEPRERVIVDGGFGPLKLSGKRSSTDVADRADFQGNAPLGEKIHEIAVVERRDAMTDALGTEEFNRFADLV